jgi:ubiquinone biosynthesis protein
VAATLTAAFIRGIGELVTADAERLQAWQRPLLRAGLGAAAALGGYLAWTAGDRQPHRRR